MANFHVNSRRCNLCVVFPNNTEVVRKEHLKECSACRLVSYCGQDHQRLDWQIHKELCSVVQRLLRQYKVKRIHQINGPILHPQDLLNVVVTVQSCVKINLRRELAPHELELISNPKCCNLCFIQKDLKHCQGCKAVSYCSERHQQMDARNHSRYCPQLRIYYDFYENPNLRELILKFEPPTYTKSTFPPNLFRLIQMTCINIGYRVPTIPCNLKEYQLFCAVSLYSNVGTLLYAINKFQLIKKAKKSLRIYLVGARDEMLTFERQYCDFLLSQLPQLESLSIFLIGPEVLRFDNLGLTIYKIDVDRWVEIQIHANAIEDFSSEGQKPDLIACFNCGFAEYVGTPMDTWNRGLKALMEYTGIPILFTSYTFLESRLDLMRFIQFAMQKQVIYQILVKEQDNRFKDFRPLRNWERFRDDVEIFYRNNFVNVVHIIN